MFLPSLQSDIFNTNLVIFTLLSTIRIQHDHGRLLSDRDGTALAPNTPLVSNKRQAADNVKLKDHIRTLEARINAIRSNTASYITRLDLACYNLYTCNHKSLRDVTFGKNIIRKAADVQIDALNDMMKEWKNDSQFFDEYFQARDEVLVHTRAHNMVQATIAATYMHIKKRFAKLDQKRGIEPNYD